jgi:(p)ppGpp synthase/HD superfamily hydrolase
MSVQLNDAELIEQARVFALKAHGDQKYGKRPYEHHLQQVFYLAKSFELPAQVQAAAWLHDVLEDTEVYFEDVMVAFGVKIFDLVNAVTNEAGKNRLERHERTYPKIRRNEYAVALKLCDRIANVRECVHTENKGLMKMYKKEQADFEKALRRPGEWEELWRALHNLLDFQAK